MEPALLRRILSSLKGETRALALYGSRARGTNRIDSDVDVLQLVEAKVKSYSSGDINVSSYHPLTLGKMARRGSLFILHLRTDAVIIEDDEGVLASALASYVQPSSYAPLFRELRVAAQALWPVQDSDKYRLGLKRLGTYILRTAVYAILAERGTPIFDTGRAAKALGQPVVANALLLRLRPNIAGPDDLRLLLDAISVVAGAVPRNCLGSVEALAISVSESYPYAASLLAQAMVGGVGNMEYTVLSLPPL